MAREFDVTNRNLARRLGGDKGLAYGFKKLEELVYEQSYRAKLRVKIVKIDKEETKDGEIVYKNRDVEEFKADKVVITDSGIFFLLYLKVGYRKPSVLEYVRKFIRAKIDSITVDYDNFVFVHLKDGRVISIKR